MGSRGRGMSRTEVGALMLPYSSAILTAGDSYNDLPLLEACRLRIVMAGAPKELVDVADYLAPSAEQDGLAVAIEDYALPRLKG